ncbi:hypothetical protein EDB89DRAFT_1939413 [Lactarius sanguifluus]|nr:hypothetical protein EDB89DRAFT_1939413 [Lactarius sanguifluus]
MSEPTLKRKRGLQDDLSRLKMVQACLDSLKHELDGIEEPEDSEALHVALEHVHKVEDILRDVKKLKVSFSSITLNDLKKVGIKREPLIFADEKIAKLVNGLTVDTEAHIADLYSRIKDIYACVNMDYKPGPRMIINAILLTLRKITSTQHTDIAILPEMKITDDDGVRIVHPTSGYELWLNGCVDYVVVEYNLEVDNKKRLLDSGAREDVFRIANGHLFLVEAKRQGHNKQDLSSYFPEAVSQAIALLKVANLPEVRFCLSDGQTWVFFILKSDDNTLTYYDSVPYRLSRDPVENTNVPLREIIQLVREWLKPTATWIPEKKTHCD